MLPGDVAIREMSSKRYSERTPAKRRLTRRAEFDRTIALGATSSQSHLRFDFDLSAWPEDLRPQARMWIAVGTTNAISTDGDLWLTFSQSGAGMTTGLNDTYDVDGTMVLGCDYAATNGEVTVAIKNRTDRPRPPLFHSRHRLSARETRSRQFAPTSLKPIVDLARSVSFARAASCSERAVSVSQQLVFAKKCFAHDSLSAIRVSQGTFSKNVSQAFRGDEVMVAYTGAGAEFEHAGRIEGIAPGG